MKTKDKTKVLPKKPTLQRPKPPSSKPKPPAPKPQVRKTTTRKTTKKATTSRKSTTKATTAKKPSSKRTIKTSSKTITKKTVTPTKKTTPSKTTPKITTSTSTVTTTRKRRTKPKTTSKPDEYAHLKSKLISDINDLRRKHHAPNLTLNNTLANQAQRIADIPRLINGGIDEKSVGFTFGVAPPEDEFNLISYWTRGAERIDYENLDEATVPRDFAQLVWVSSKEIGCGISVTDSNRVITFICFFYPKGNIPGQYRENVLRP
uniref:SCP domain-containing protein n=1 Tax=Strongyloides papillosus TaxID=174720 RepID=A0A0N5BHQ3_STREA